MSYHHRFEGMERHTDAFHMACAAWLVVEEPISQVSMMEKME